MRENLLRGRETALRQNGFWLNLLESQALWGDDPIDNFQTFASRVKALDAASLRALARVLFNETNLARFTLLPERDGGAKH